MYFSLLHVTLPCLIYFMLLSPQLLVDKIIKAQKELANLPRYERINGGVMVHIWELLPRAVTLFQFFFFWFWILG